jgi:two-component system OmpR family response regulator
MSAPSSPRVLVVDDDQDISEMVAIVLEQQGWEVATADNGLTALDRMRAGWQPDVILLDMRMPVMNGREFVSAYRAGPPPHVPIVLVSAARDARESAEAVAADAWLAKPFDIDHLLATVDRYRDSRLS